MAVNEDGFRFEARGRVIHAGAVKRRRVFMWRNLVRRPPRTANQPGCPLQVIRPRLYSYASIGSLGMTTESAIRFPDWRRVPPGVGVDRALPRIHRDVHETFAAARERGETPGMSGFYAGVTRAAVVVRSVRADDVESALLTLESTGA